MPPTVKAAAIAAVNRLAKSGIHIARTEPRTKAQGQLVTDADLAKLDADLEGIFRNGKAFGTVWPSATSVRKYLSNERVNFYYKIIGAAADAGVKLSGKVLDIGTCSGYLLRIAQDRYGSSEVIGTDYYQECVDLSLALAPGSRVFKASIADLQDSDERYDAIFCTEVLEHIVDTETQIPIMMGLLNPGGALMVTVPNGRFDNTSGHTSDDGVSWVGHVNFWSPQSWQFYIDRVAAPWRHTIGSTGVHYEDDALYAVIFKD